MTQTIRTIRIATQGPAGPASLYPQAFWSAGSVPYARSTVLAHNGAIWLALRSTSVEPSAGVPDDWASWLDFSGTFATLGGDGKIPTSQLPASILGALNYQGTWNASTNSPTIPAAASGNKGWYYKVSVAGTTTVSGINDWGVGDWIVSNGATWDKIDNTDQILSVAGLTGAIGTSALKTALAISAGDVSGLGALAALNIGSGLTSAAGNLSANVTSVAGRTGAVTLAQADISGLTTASSPSFAGITSSAFATAPGAYNAQTGTSYTLQASDSGKIVTLSNAAAITLTVPSGLGAGFSCLLIQLGAGQVSVVGAGATINSYGSLTKLAGRYASANLIANVADSFVLAGVLG